MDVLEANSVPAGGGDAAGYDNKSWREGEGNCDPRARIVRSGGHGRVTVSLGSGGVLAGGRRWSVACSNA